MSDAQSHIKYDQASSMNLVFKTSALYKRCFCSHTHTQPTRAHARAAPPRFPVVLTERSAKRTTRKTAPSATLATPSAAPRWLGAHRPALVRFAHAVVVSAPHTRTPNHHHILFIYNDYYYATLYIYTHHCKVRGPCTD